MASSPTHFAMKPVSESAIYYPTGRIIVAAVGMFSAIALACTLSAAIRAWEDGPSGLTTIYIFAAGWAVVPPIWFWIEFFWIYDAYGRPNSLERFRYGQQVSVAIWAGVTLSLAGLATSDHFKVAKDKCHCDVTLSSPAQPPASPAATRTPAPATTDSLHPHETADARTAAKQSAAARTATPRSAGSPQPK